MLGQIPAVDSWSRDGVIVLNFEGVSYGVPASGGKPIPVTEAYKAHDESNHIYPNFSRMAVISCSSYSR